MNFSADELDILRYLESWGGKFVTMVEICRCAGGRQRYRDNPHWAKALMSRLVDSGEVAVNERGHYCRIDPTKPSQTASSKLPLPGQPPPASPARTPTIVGDNYFPANDGESETDQSRWVSPQIAAILKKSGKNFGGK